MKVYKINVNGKSYVVEIESISESNTPKEEIKKTTKPVESKSSDVEKVFAPMQGTITKVSATFGSKVKKGSVLFVLEAMKLENEIIAAKDGTILELHVKAGDKVETGQLLLVIG
jgi:biotin carboxyl carrier protein